jgi:hypothetical protein
MRTRRRSTNRRPAVPEERRGRAREARAAEDRRRPRHQHAPRIHQRRRAFRTTGTSRRSRATRGVDGMPVEREASQEWDLRDGVGAHEGLAAGGRSTRKRGSTACGSARRARSTRRSGSAAAASNRRTRSRSCAAVRRGPRGGSAEHGRSGTGAHGPGRQARRDVNALYPQRALPASADAFEDDRHPPQHTSAAAAPSAAAAEESGSAEDRPPTVDAVKHRQGRAKQGETNGPQVDAVRR